MVYQPREDSFLIKKYVKKYAYGKVLDMGTGSGILAVEAAKCGKTEKVYAADIDEDAVKECKKAAEGNKKAAKGAKKIVCVKSDLFSYFKGKKIKFDLITFNAPYLPTDKKYPDVALDGGEKGYEVIERFLNEAGKYLAKDGVILLLISSLTKKRKVEGIMKKKGFGFKTLEKKHYFFEELFVYEIRKIANKRKT